MPDLAAARRALAELEAQVRRALNVPPLTPTVEAGPLERDLGRVRTLIDQALAKPRLRCPCRPTWRRSGGN